MGALAAWLDGVGASARLLQTELATASATASHQLGAQMSSVAPISITGGGDYSASRAIDGDLTSLVASDNEPNAWLSVRVGADAPPLGLVAVYNRADDAQFQAWLSPFEVYVGSGFGSLASACTPSPPPPSPPPPPPPRPHLRSRP